MQNFDEQNEEALWLKKLLDTESELFVPLSAWENMETGLNKTFGEQANINMEELFPLPNYATANMDNKLDEYYNQLFDNNLSEKTNQDTPSLPPNAWSGMQQLLDKEFANDEADNSRESIQFPDEIALPIGAWASMDLLLNATFETNDATSKEELLDLPNEFALPPNAWALMESTLEAALETSEIEDYIKEPQWNPNESFSLPQDAWALMEEKLDNKDTGENKSKKLLKYSLLALFLGGILAGGYYYFNSNNAADNNSNKYQDNFGTQTIANLMQEVYNISKSNANIKQTNQYPLAENNTKNAAHSSQNNKNNAIFERISNSLVQPKSLYDKFSTQQQDAASNTAKYRLPTTINQPQKGSEIIAPLQLKNKSSNEEIFEKGSSVFDNIKSDAPSQDLPSTVSPANMPIAAIEARENQLNSAATESQNIDFVQTEFPIDNTESVAENKVNNTIENIAIENIDHIDIADNNAILQALEIALDQATIEEIIAEEILDSFELKNSNPPANIKRWKLYAHAGIASKIMKNKNFSAAPHIGAGASYNINDKHKINLGLNLKQMYPNGGLMGLQAKAKTVELDNKQQEVLEEFNAAVPVNYIPQDYANSNISQIDIYQLKSITMLEAPISFQKQISRKHVLEIGIKVGMNLFANMRREKNNSANTSPIDITRYDIGLSLLNFGAFASYEYKINENFSLIAQYSKSFGNMLRAAENRTKVYTSYAGHMPQDGNVYLSMTGMIKDNTSVLVETPNTLLNSDLLLAIRYHF